MLKDDLDRFYSLLRLLEIRPGQGRPLSEYSGRSGLPTRGVYFFREPNENRQADPGVPRIVRVGTHAVSAGSKSTLWGRLRTHRGGRSGGGNHRGSIFRLHVGAALLRRDQGRLGELATWSQGSSAPRTVRDGEAVHEQRVSAYLGSLSILWVQIPDEPGPLSGRAIVERNAIALLSNQLRPLDPPSQNWLGLSSPRSEIRESGLWNLNYVRDHYDPAFLDTLAVFVD
jgi:hypothetical protein